MIPGGFLAGFGHIWGATGWRFIAGALVATAPAYLVGACEGKQAAEAAFSAREQAARVESLSRARKADAALSEARAANERAIIEQRKDYDHAVTGIPDQRLSARQLAAYCLQRAREGRTDSACTAVPGRADALPKR